MRPLGLAVWCDLAGSLVEVVRDELGLVAHLDPGGRLGSICSPDSRQKFARFLVELEQAGAAYQWEMNVGSDAAPPRPFHFTGGRSGNQVFVVCAETAEENRQLYEEVLAINTEQINELRRSLERLRDERKRRRRIEAETYDGMSALNNELVNLQRRLAKSNRQLQNLNEQKNELLGIAAHDLRNPLGAIQLFCRLIPAIGSLAPRQAELVERIANTSRFMQQLVDDLLDVSIIESGKLRLDRRPVEVRAVLAESIDLHRILADQKPIRVELDDRAMAGVRLRLDSGKMLQVFNNLLSNAIKYSEPETTVRVTASADDREMVVRIRDEGQGIPEAELGSLFELFHRGSGRATGGERSTGLGLAIAHRIVTEHGGRLEAESTLGEGTEMRVVLPLGDPGEVEDRAPGVETTTGSPPADRRDVDPPGGSEPADDA